MIRILVLALVVLFVQTHNHRGSDPPDSPSPDTTQNLSRSAAALRESYRGLSSPELERRKAVRRAIQQRGYASVLHDLLEDDGLSALLAFLRLHAQLDFHLPRNTLVVYARVQQPDLPSWEKQLPGTSGAPSAPIAIPLNEDFSFPIDPWSKAR